MRDKRPAGSSEAGPGGPLFFEALRGLGADPFILAVRETASRAGVGVYIVGGVPRNILLRRPLPSDYDFVSEGVPSSAREVAEGAASVLGGSAFVLDRENGLYRVTVPARPAGGAGPVTLDFLPLRHPSIEDDLRRRDFTVNAMAIPLEALFRAFEGREGGKGRAGGAVEKREDMEVGALLIDPLGGAQDAARGVLRLVSPRALVEDPLRCIRAVRLGAEYGLRIDEGAAEEIKKHAHLILERRVAGERIRDELAIIFRNGGTEEAIKTLIDLNVLDAVLTTGGWPMTEASLHDAMASLPVLVGTERVIGSILDGKFTPCPAGMRGCIEAPVPRGIIPLPGGAAPVLKLAAFFYDLSSGAAGAAGAAGERTRGEGPCRTAGHVLRGLAFGRKTIRQVRGLLEALDIWRSAPARALRNPAFEALFLHIIERKAGLAPPVFFILAIAVEKAEPEKDSEARLTSARAMVERCFGMYDGAAPLPLIGGEEIIRDFNVPEGEEVGSISGALEGAVRRCSGWSRR